jgi:diguanylate cyclase (GGDEF)-like protein/PAS domain S-box-containing protein
MANGGPKLKGLQVLVVAPPSKRARALTRHLASMSSWASKHIADIEEVPGVLRDGTWHAVVLEHNPAWTDAESQLRSVIIDAGQRPVIVVGDDPGGSAVARMLRLGAADFAVIADLDDVVLALQHVVGEDRQSRRRFVEAAAAFGIDVTDRKDADATRDQALKALTEAQEIAGVGSWMWNAATNEVEWSAQMKRIFGLALDADPPDDQALFALIERHDRRTVARALRQVVAGGPMFEIECRIDAADGARRIVHALGRADPDRPGAYSGTVQDVTELRAIERDVQAARERFRVAFENAPVGMTIATADGRVLQANGSMCDITGYTSDELLTMNIATITHPEELEERTQLNAQLTDGEIDSYIRDGRLLRANGEAVWVSRHVRMLRDEDGSPLQVLTHFVDITERRMMERELRHMADHDPLTGLLNRRGLETELARHVAHVNRYGDRGALLVLDLDHFKAVNDTLGHEAGDRLIVTVATLLRNRLRVSDAVARLGGDEFAILLPDANADVAQHVAEEIVADIQRNAVVEHRQTSRHVTASVGVTMFTQGHLNADGVLVDADLAMYDAKDAGRDQVAMRTGTTAPISS